MIPKAAYFAIRWVLFLVLVYSTPTETCGGTWFGDRWSWIDLHSRIISDSIARWQGPFLAGIGLVTLTYLWNTRMNLCIALEHMQAPLSIFRISYLGLLWTLPLSSCLEPAYIPCRPRLLLPLDSRLVAFSTSLRSEVVPRLSGHSSNFFTIRQGSSPLLFSVLCSTVLLATIWRLFIDLFSP